MTLKGHDQDHLGLIDQAGGRETWSPSCKLPTQYSVRLVLA